MTRVAVIAAAATALLWCFRPGGLRPASLSWGRIEEKPVRMVVLMYHSIDSNPCRSGSYTITPAEFRKDLTYLKEKGYNTVVVSDLIGYVQDGTPLPPKPVMITFDDGYYNNYLNAFPLLQEFQMRAVISVIGEEVDRFSLVDEPSERYASLNWHQVQEMQNSGLVEFQNHGYGIHAVGGRRHGLRKKSGEAAQAYADSLRVDIAKVQYRFVEMLGRAPEAFAYPYGVVTREGDQVLREMGFLATLDAQGKVFQLTHEEECLWRIPRYNRPAGTTAQCILEKALDP